MNQSVLLNMYANDSTEQMMFIDIFLKLYMFILLVKALVTAFKKTWDYKVINLTFRKAHFVPLREEEGKTYHTNPRQTEHVTSIVTSDLAIQKIKPRPDLVQSGGH